MKNKKIIAITSLSLVGLLAAPAIYADAQPTAGSSLLTAIQNLTQTVVKIADTASKTYHSENYQASPSMQKNEASNVANNDAKKITTDTTYNTTDDQIKEKLQSIPYSILSSQTGAQDADKVSNFWKNKNKLMKSLTTEAPASDTLYYNDPTVASMSFLTGSNNMLQKPKTMNDDYFNAASILGPTNYTPEQKKAAEMFSTYLTQDYSYPSDNINFNRVRNKISQLKGDRKYSDINVLLNNLMNDPSYQKYQLTVRSNTAASSVSHDSLNHLIAERTPVKNLGATANIKDANGKPIIDASPLDVEKYTATHRVKSKQWYDQVQAAAPATVQRETLVVLSEIEAQLYQAHLDRERMITLMATQQALLSSQNNMLLQSQSQSLNQTIDSLTNNNSDNNEKKQSAEALLNKK